MGNLIARPKFFKELIDLACVTENDIISAPDNFFAIYKSISDILKSRNIDMFIDSENNAFRCDLFFDDWFLYAVPQQFDYVYGLFKLREQENDDDLVADGDIPGVTISFVALDTQILKSCLTEKTQECTKLLGAEINRVVAHRGQKYHPKMKEYFVKPEADGAYLVAELYVKHIASFAENGFVEVPEVYKEIYKNQKDKRISDFIEQVNNDAGYVVCNHEKIFIKDMSDLSRYEKLAILATYTGNVSVHSFGAEVEFHAHFLTGLARIKLPFWRNSVYDSAIRADMSIGDSELQGPTPYYRLESGIVKRHKRFHSDW